MTIKELKSMLEKFDENMEVRIASVTIGSPEVAFDIEAMTEATEDDPDNGYTGKFAMIYSDIFEQGIPYKS